MECPLNWGKSNLTPIIKTHPDDLKHFGLIPEFIGRFPVIASLLQLAADALVSILTEPKNALVRQYSQLFTYDNVELEFTPGAVKANAEQALSRGPGARGLKGVLVNLLQKTMFDLPSQTDIARCVVDKNAVNAAGEIALIRSSDNEDSEIVEV